MGTLAVQAGADMKKHQLGLFQPAKNFPKGFVYQPEVVSPAEERSIVSLMADLPFREFEFRGYQGKRRVVSFGWRYDFNKAKLERVEDIPASILSLRETAAAGMQMPADGFQQVLVTEYPPGAAIGWHKDRPMFGEVIGISLLAACTFRLRRKREDAWERASFVVEPRSAYLLSGPARSEWEHSIPPVDTLRYSITFRNFKAGKSPA
jgi:alkylated DNA repair dioxygenase AlkB